MVVLYSKPTLGLDNGFADFHVEESNRRLRQEHPPPATMVTREPASCRYSASAMPTNVSEHESRKACPLFVVFLAIELPAERELVHQRIQVNVFVVERPTVKKVVRFRLCYVS